MSRFGRNAVVALLGSIVLTGLVMPGPASAATRPAVQLKVCNKTNQELGFRVAGLDEHGRWTDVRIVAYVAPRSCSNPVPKYGRDERTVQWWATNQWVKVFLKTSWPQEKRQWQDTCHISKSARNGSTMTCAIVRVPR